MNEIGERLKQARLQKNIQLEEIATRTNINLSFLQQIEQNKFDFLPTPYVIGFIKSFAKQVGLNGNELTQSFKRSQETPIDGQAAFKSSFEEGSSATEIYMPEPRHAQAQKADLKLPYLKEITLGLGAVLVLALLFLIASKSSGDKPAGSPNKLNSTEPSKASVKEIPFEQMAKEAAEKTSPEPAEVLPELVLQAVVQDSAWIQVVIDGEDTTDSIFAPGMSQTWNAKKEFRVRLGNAGAVKLTLNGEDLGAVGAAGQVVDLHLNRSGIVDKKARGGRQS